MKLGTIKQNKGSFRVAIWKDQAPWECREKFYVMNKTAFKTYRKQ